MLEQYVCFVNQRKIWWLPSSAATGWHKWRHQRSISSGWAGICYHPPRPFSRVTQRQIDRGRQLQHHLHWTI